jgi:hypothetical protein
VAKPGSEFCDRVQVDNWSPKLRIVGTELTAKSQSKERKMKKRIIPFLLAFVFAMNATAASRRNALGAFTNITIPVMANTAGLQGSFFRTRVAILNPTQLSYSIDATLFSNAGQVAKATINMAPGQVRNYENFLQQIFNFSGAGAVEFDSLSGAQGGSTGRDFIVTSEVYTDGPGGSYKTVVSSGPSLEDTLPDFDNFSLGINVNANSRANVGAFNSSAGANEINADVYDSSGTLLNTVTLTLAAKTWNQVVVPVNVTGGFIKWRLQSAAFCYAVVVDNKSNDGTFIPASDYVP